MREEPVNWGAKETVSSWTSRMNLPGLITGLLMLILPFMGAWWKATVGEGALEVAISPFYYSLEFASVSLTSSLIGYFILAAKLTVLIGGGFMVLGSLRANTWWGRKLVNWGAMKIVWMLISLVGIVVVGALLANNFLSSMLAGLIGEGATLDLGLPYLVGTGEASVTMEDSVSLLAPVTTGLTLSFWLAALTAVLGMFTKFYQKMKSWEGEPGEVETVEPDRSD